MNRGVGGTFFTRRTWSACCASCGGFIDVYQGPKERIAADAKREMRGEGWKETVGRGWMCPECLNRNVSTNNP